MPAKIALISLGCSKNLVESEQMLAALEAAGFGIAPDPDGADACVINTCGFIESAKAEAVDTILEMAELKKAGRLGAIIAAGCLAERYKEEIQTELPELDAVIGVGGAGLIAEAVAAALEGRDYSAFPDIDAPVTERDRIITTGPGYAYVKIAEGCDNRCAYCVIPFIRGKYRSRKIEDVLSECRNLVSGGVSELIIVAQDTTMYGRDIYGKPSLARLLRELDGLDGAEWIRVHYLYPDNLDDELLELFSSARRLVRYFDIPLQHVSGRLLKSMNRRYSGREAEELINKIRSMMPDAVIRTSVIVGLPGETEQDFSELCDFLKRMKLERVGVFSYSAEEGSAAAGMDNQVDEDIKLSRLEAVYAIQERVMEDYNKSRVGSVLRVLCEGYDDEMLLWHGRSAADSPEVDGRVYFGAERDIIIGSFVEVRVENVLEEDLLGSALI